MASFAAIPAGVFAARGFGIIRGEAGGTSCNRVLRCAGRPRVNL
eukprot:gene6683-8685_t